MLFIHEDTKQSEFELKESYKERNLYFKIFCGYLFNELIDGYIERIDSFFTLLKNTISENSEERFYSNSNKSNCIDTLKKIQENRFFVSFDYHLDQIKKNSDRGEMSDVVLWSIDNFISIEIKYLTNWTYKKDIVSVQKRMLEACKYLEQKDPIQVLLIDSKKWNNSIKKKKQHGNQLIELIKNRNKLEFPLIIITWQDIVNIVKEEKIKKYINSQLKRSY